MTDEVCREIQGVRRIIFHAVYEAGGTHFILESFHFNWGNEGGNQASLLPNGGNTCQSLLRDARYLPTGEIMGNWAPATADKLAAPFGYTC